jgi:YVTN family beta-propeller protein
MIISHNYTQYLSGRIGAFSAQCLFLLVLFVLGAVMAVAQGKPSVARRIAPARTGPGVKSAPEAKRPPPLQRIVREGVAVEFNIAPLADRAGGGAKLMEETDAIVTFKITDTTTGTPITNMRPSAWLDSRINDKPSEMKECREKIQSFLQGSLGARPEIDLNAYYLLVMNSEANISVIDPLLGLGTSKLFTLILLDSPGEDWVMSRDGKRLFVTMPLVNQVAVVDTVTFKVVSKIHVGMRPTHIAFQPDEKYVWVSTESPRDSGVTVIDSVSFKVAARIATGAGRHEIAFAEDDRFAFVTNSEQSTLSVIDTQRLKKIKDVKTGVPLTSPAFSPLSKAVYATSDSQGVVVVVDARSHRVVARVKAKPGLKVIRFAPAGRWGFVANSKENTVYILDSSTNRILHTVGIGNQPDQIVFTQSFAYIRSMSTEQISLIPLADLGKSAAKITQFSGGQYPPGKFGATAGADAIVPAPEGNATLVANPADKMIYFYKEGMIAPMGSFQNYRREPRALMVVDRSMRETSPGVYSNVVKLPPAGNHEVVLLTDSPRISQCFDLTVVTNPSLKKKGLPLAIEPLFKQGEVPVQESIRLQFKVVDPETKKPKTGLKDVGVLTFLSPGVWQKRQWARPDGEGGYEVEFTPPKQGVYFVFFECPSLGVRFNQLPYAVLQARDGKAKSP